MFQLQSDTRSSATEDILQPYPAQSTFDGEKFRLMINDIKWIIYPCLEIPNYYHGSRATCLIYGSDLN